MKLFIAFLLPFVLLSCSSKVVQKMDESTITYQALSRGFYMKVEIQGNKLSFAPDRNSELQEIVLKNSDVEELQKAFEKIDLNELQNFKAPTEKRFYDGAAIASLTIAHEGKSYNSQDFDHENPPAEIADFINKIVLLTEK